MNFLQDWIARLGSTSSVYDRWSRLGRFDLVLLRNVLFQTNPIHPFLGVPGQHGLDCQFQILAVNSTKLFQFPVQLIIVDILKILNEDSIHLFQQSRLKNDNSKNENIRFVRIAVGYRSLIF